MNSASPKGVDGASYKPSSKTPATCPKLSKSWQAAPDLPPTPSTDLCNCMVQSRKCIPKKGLATKKFGDIFDFVCSKDKKLCSGIGGDPETGVYGAYSMCDDASKLAFVLDAYYSKMQSASDACDFDGQAQVQSAKKDSACLKNLDAADKVNKQAATATSAVDGVKATGGASGSDASSKKTDDAASAGIMGSSILSALSIGGYTVGLYAVVAAAAMVAM